MTDLPPPAPTPSAPSPPPGGGDLPPDAQDEGSFRSGLAQGLLALGLALVPLGLGAMAGYWAADREVRWVPTMAGALCLVLIVACGCMGTGLYLLGPAQGRRAGRRRILGLALLVLIAAAGRVAVLRLGGLSPLTTMERSAFDEAARLDARQMRELDRALEGTVARLAALPALSPDGARSADGSARPLSADEEQQVVSAWRTYFEAALALDRIRLFYEDYYHFDLSRAERPRHLRSFLLTFAAELALYERTASLIEVLDRNENARKLLELERPDLGIAAGSVTKVREELSGITDLSRVVGGKTYMRWLRLAHGADREAIAWGSDDLWADVDRLLAQVERRRRTDLAMITLSADAAPLGREVKRRLTFPVQAGVAEWLGDTRVGRPVGRYLISREQLTEVAGKCEPGDIMLGRKNWYLSNIGLPGFWPHAMLWTGTPADLRRTFDQDADTLAWVKRQGGTGTFTEHLAREHPLAWRAALDASGEGGAHPAEERHDPLVIIEAISEGVTHNSFAHAAGDYLVALRPRLPTWVKAQAIARAFAYLGRPYDFDFDFATDTSLVCSEVVWRSYRPVGDTPGLRLEPTLVAGRRCLAPTDMARMVQQEHGRADRQLDFVAFVDALEAEQRAVLSDEAAFLSTPDRSKWDVAQR